MEKHPVLVTLTAPSAGGKSYLFNYIRDVAKMPCLISTTTRPPRANEVEGVDYFFITEEESKRLEAEGQFAELAIYRGVRYGVTKTEFHNKLSQGIAFLVVEPGGIEHYAQPAIDVGATHFKAFVHTEPEVRISRFKARARADMLQALDTAGREGGELSFNVLKVMNAYLDRFHAMLTEETKWFQMCHWDRVLFGTDEPAVNLQIILNDIKVQQDKLGL